MGMCPYCSALEPIADWIQHGVHSGGQVARYRPIRDSHQGRKMVEMDSLAPGEGGGLLALNLALNFPNGLMRTVQQYPQRCNESMNRRGAAQ